MRTIARQVCIVIAVAWVTVLSAGQARAAIESRNVLKTFFETGDVPTSDQFSTFIDSYVHKTDDGLYTLIGVGSDTSRGDLRARRNQESDTLDVSIAYAPPGSHPPLAPDWAGFSGYLALEYQDSTGQPHFGYLEMNMDAASIPPLSTGPAIHVTGWSWDTVANEAVVAAPIPEPTSIAGAIFAVGLLGRRRRY